jgi:hypothetical protein
MLEKFVSLLERAVAALEKLASAPVAVPAGAATPQENAGTSKPAKSSKPKETPKEPEKPKDDTSFLDADEESVVEYTKDDVRNALIEAGKRLGASDKAQAILKKVGGAETLGGLDKSKFAAVIKAAKEAKAE